jgi:hypothetical protein
MVDTVGHALDVEVLDESGSGAVVILGSSIAQNSKKDRDCAPIFCLISSYKK